MRDVAPQSGTNVVNMYAQEQGADQELQKDVFGPYRGDFSAAGGMPWTVAEPSTQSLRKRVRRPDL